MKCALVAGSAIGWELEMARAEEMLGREFDAFYVVKMNGIVWPKPGRFVWVTLHPEFQDEYVAKRKAAGLHMDFEIVSATETLSREHAKKGHIQRHVDYRVDKNMTASQGSGGFAAKVACQDGFERVVMVGCPMTKEGGHFIRGKWVTDRQSRFGVHPTDPASFEQGFERCIPFFAGRVRSTSGWTKEKLGEPTPEWLRGDPQPFASAKALEGFQAGAGCPA